jgi:hypothetical protein
VQAIQSPTQLVPEAVSFVHSNRGRRWSYTSTSFNVYIVWGLINIAQGLYLYIHLIGDHETHPTAKISNLKQRVDEFGATFRKVSCVANTADPYGRNLGL